MRMVVPEAENIIRHLNNIYEEEELVKEATTKKFLVVRKEGNQVSSMGY